MNDFTVFLKQRKKVNLAMVVVNIIVFIVMELAGSTKSSQFMLMHGASYTPYVLKGDYWRLLTCMFLHFGFEHLAYNMFSLIFLGDIVERIFGPVRYLMIYLIGGVGGNLVSLWLSLRSGNYAVSAGASGAIFACMGAFLFTALRRRKNLGQDTMRRLLMMVVLMVMQGLVDHGVDNAAHVGGLIAGFLLAAMLYLPRRRVSKVGK